MALLKQNKGKSHKMSDPHKTGSNIPPAAGRKAVRFEGTCVHAAVEAGVTRPHSHNAGSHDDKTREHGGE
jgi:hypothetical protein